MLKIQKRSFQLIKYSFGGGGRKVEKLRLSYPRDFAHNQMIEQQIKKRQTEHYGKVAEEFRLSKALDISERAVLKGEVYTPPEPEKFNKILRRDYVQSINKTPPEVDDETISLEDKTLKWSENRVMIKEAEKFKKIYFKKNETNRLQLRESVRPTNYLPQQMLHDAGETNFLELSKKNENFSHSINSLQQQRISRLENSLVGQKQEENIYGFLVKSQITNIEQAKEKLNQVVQEIISTQSSVYQQSSSEVAHHFKSDQLVSRVLEGIDIEKHSVDQEALKTFFDKLLIQNQEQSIALMNHLQEHNQIINYQEFLFDKFHNQDINLRYQGKLEFNQLTEQEVLNYIKNDINRPDLILRAADTLQRDEQQNPKYYPQLLQKLAIIKPEHKLQKLAYFEDYKYRNLIRKITTDITEYDDITFSQSIQALNLLNVGVLTICMPKVCRHLYKKISNELLDRLSYIETSYFSMIARSLHAFPFTANSLFQFRIANEIKIRTENKKLSLYEVESFLMYINQCYPRVLKTFEQTRIQLIKNFTEHAKQDFLKIDEKSITCLAQSLIKLNQNPVTREILTKLESEIISFLPKLSVEDLSTVALMLCTTKTPKQNLIVVKTKKEIVNALVLKNKETYDISLAKAMCSFAMIDTQHLFLGIEHVNEFLMFSITFPRFAFASQSPQYIPYTKVLKSINENPKGYDKESLQLIIKGLLLVKHQNKTAILETLNIFFEWDPLNPNFEKMKEQSLSDLSLGIYTYCQINYMDDFLKFLEGTFMKKLDQNLNICKLETIMNILQARFHLQYDQHQLLFLQKISKGTLKNMEQHEEIWTLKNIIQFTYFYLGLCFRSLNKKEQLSLPESSKLIVQMLMEKISDFNSQIQDLNIEYQYILSLVQQILSTIPDLQNFILKGLKCQIGTFKGLLDYQQRITDEYIMNIGTERLKIDQIKDSILTELSQMKLKVEINTFIQNQTNILTNVDFLITDLKKGIKIISINSLNQHNFDENLTFHLPGVYFLNSALSRRVYGVDLIYIIAEEYSRLTEQELIKVSSCQEFLKEKLKL